MVASRFAVFQKDIIQISTLSILWDSIAKSFENLAWDIIDTSYILHLNLNKSISRCLKWLSYFVL